MEEEATEEPVEVEPEPELEETPAEEEDQQQEETNDPADGEELEVDTGEEAVDAGFTFNFDDLPLLDYSRYMAWSSDVLKLLYHLFRFDWPW